MRTVSRTSPDFASRFSQTAQNLKQFLEKRLFVSLRRLSISEYCARLHRQRYTSDRMKMYSSTNTLQTYRHQRNYLRICDLKSHKDSRLLEKSVLILCKGIFLVRTRSARQHPDMRLRGLCAPSTEVSQPNADLVITKF